MSYEEIRIMLKNQCNKSQMSQKHIAELAGLTEVTLNRFIKGHSHIRGDNLESLLGVFGMTLKAGKVRKK